MLCIVYFAILKFTCRQLVSSAALDNSVGPGVARTFRLRAIIFRELDIVKYVLIYVCKLDAFLDS
jgi:hypothetical protein